MHTLSPSAHLSHDRGEPRGCYRRWREGLQCDEALLVVDFPFDPYWLEGAAPQALTAIYWVRGRELRVAVTDRALVGQGLPPAEEYLRWIDAHGLASFGPDEPMGLQPESIDKPWGCEIWFTGVERRGVCHFTRGGGRTPIPWLQAALPDPLAGAPGEQLLLLKILDPSPHPVRGDLYFELHESKREVYVVTAVDRRAWPDGTGYIRYGFDQQLRARYGDDERFRADYLAAVLAYEAVRRELDDIAGSGGAPGSALLARERALGEHMQAFTHLHPLRVGDVIQVPLRLPHALQHGVRTVEFQTPSYERKILSFGQKVLTQDHWDTREAVACMELAGPALAPPRQLAPAAGGARVELVVDFPDFEVLRISLPPGAHWRAEPEASYRVLMVLAGILDLAGARWEAEQALLLPALWRGQLSGGQGASPLVFLLARPRS